MVSCRTFFLAAFPRRRNLIFLEFTRFVRLTQIKLSGFKSFVDPTAIHVPGQLVGIVGPNGCGKSNVIDAVRWVLGESRASALRGDSMQDVIFNGSVNRKPLARASVELLFDNSQGRAAGQWSQYAEISVKRVLQRDGESSYHINNTHVRRRDITDMFLGTGLGPRAYAIVEQGTISRVIEAKPEELRVFLEEAAGVSKYKERRRETENRLSDTRENLARVTDIRLELGAQIEKLEAQAEVASRYKQFQAEQQFKQHLLWFLRRRDAANERDRHARDIVNSSNELEAETAKLREVELELEAARAAHYKTGDSMNAAQAALYGANAEVARHESELRHVEETRQRLENQHTERRIQLSSWREQRSELTQALHMWAARTETAKQRVAETQSRLADEGAKLPRAEEAFRYLQERLSEAQGRSMRAESGLQLEQANLVHLERGIQALDLRQERLQGELETLPKPDAAELAALDALIGAIDESIADAERGIDALQSEFVGLEEQQSDAMARVEHASREVAAAEARLATLRQIQAAAEDNAPLHEWLETHGLSALPRLWQKLRIDSGWETAVEAVLRERLHALELEDPARLEALASDQPPVKASLFMRGAAAAAPELLHGHVALATKVRASEAAVSGAIADWLSDIYAAETVPGVSERARLPEGAVLVNRAGHQFTRHTLSFHAPDPSDAGLLARQGEIDTLEARSGELDSKLGRAREALQRIESELARREAALEGARDALAVNQTERHDRQIQLLKLNQAQERYSERSGQIGGELTEIARDVNQGRERLIECQAAVARIEEEIRASREDLEVVKGEHLAAEDRLADQRREIQRAERASQDALFGERECASKINEIDNSVRVIDQQIGNAEVEIAKLTEELAEDPVPAVREALAAAVEARIGCERTLAEARNAVEVAAGVLRGFEEQRLQIEGRIAPLRERVGELRLKEQAAQINHDQFELQLREAAADEARLEAEAESAPRPSTLQAELTRLTQSINELGAVNLAALEELHGSRERKGYLDSQSADLEEAVATLEDAIRRIDRETRELLRETFESVNRHFGSLFPALFGGGEAKLIMTGEEILDAGVQVMAQPPGKRNSTIHLLSGGEKALTAIALVFAMFQLNPAPFCLLDEVDAPLDDTNTVRFCELVRKMSTQTQFLFISHNKLTMELAAQLVGVTMPESGISRVVAVDIDEALRMREELAA
jgi:chromosome segregation protein